MQKPARQMLLWRRTGWDMALQYGLSCLLAWLVADVITRTVANISTFTLVGYTVCAWLGFLALTHLNLKRQPHQRLVVLDSEQRIWIGPPDEINNQTDDTLPSLRSYRTYAGLIWLSNTANQACLIWPGSLATNDQRQLRIWLQV